ncbi:hypothetical protein K1T71_005498, partial [Dendrolimus kikuchii]
VYCTTVIKSLPTYTPVVSASLFNVSSRDEAISSGRKLSTRFTRGGALVAKTGAVQPTPLFRRLRRENRLYRLYDSTAS